MSSSPGRSAKEEQGTFQPEISEYARLFPAADAPLSERAVEEAAERRRWRQEAKREQEERSSPRFRPDTGYASRSGVHSSGNSSSRKTPRSRSSPLPSSDEDEDSFAPEISTYARSLIRDEPVHERLYNIAKNKSGKSLEVNDTVDPITGAPLFHPVTNPVFTVRDERVEDSLYKDAANRQLRKALLVESIVTAEEHQRKAPKITKRSKSLSRKLLEKDILEAFEAVDKNGYGTISNDQLEDALIELGLFKKVENEERRKQSEIELHEELWKVLDPRETGAVDFPTFRREMLKILDVPLDSSGVESPKKSLASKFRFLAVNRLAYSSTKNLNKRSPYESPLSPSSSPSARKGGRPSSKRSSERRSPESFFKELQEEQRLREAALQQKKEELEQKEVAECTFTPKINKLPPNMSYRREAGFSFNKGPNPPRSEKELEAIRKEVLKKGRREEVPGEECTFKPAISRNRHAPKPKATPTGFDQAISRMRMAQQNRHENSQTRFFSSLRIKDEEASASQLVQSGGKKRGSKGPNRTTEVKPFDFELEKRKRTKPLLYIDVNLGHGKTGRIGVHENDDPTVLARNFASSYHLDEFLCKRLEELIISHMEAQAIPAASSGSASRRESGEYTERGLYDEFENVRQTGSYDHQGGYDEQFEYDYQPEDSDYYEPPAQKGQLTTSDLVGSGVDHGEL